MIKIKESELRFSFVRSQGPGGQNVNKVSTAILSIGAILTGFGSIALGVLLNTISHRFRETTRLIGAVLRQRDTRNESS